MDPIDPFYQQLDSEVWLARHGPSLAAEARDVLAKTPNLRVAGMIVMPDSAEAEQLRRMLTTAAGAAPPAGVPMIGLCPRPMIEPFLRRHIDDGHWLEEPWQPQTVLAVVVSTRDGFRFGFFGVGDAGSTG